MRKKNKYFKATVLVWACIFVLSLRLVQVHTVGVCHVPGISMEDAIWAGDRLLIYKTRNHIKHKDIIIFNHPNGDGTQLIKRCIGLPGDTVILIEGQVHINGKTVTTPATVKIPSTTYFLDFPHPNLEWTTNDYGPVIVPSKGLTIHLDSTNVELYRHMITFEGYNVHRQDSIIYIDGTPTNTYTFATDGYFVLGDNRGNSSDSRYWGFVAQQLIVGKPVLVYFSKDKEAKRIRWNRIGITPK